MWTPWPELVWILNKYPDHRVTIKLVQLTDPRREQYLAECECGWSQWNIAENPAVLYAARHQHNTRQQTPT
ncbi:hypothetical protein [Nocardia sp. XZ_19_369]|uniref:hypothetical protein n=1 Tax=Nocardia sp. XZ_19_369 TaxID=2769487 RepID=UPI00188F2950|nr:hypothetical protein [Nocardia sp. XZ_19_369]